MVSGARSLEFLGSQTTPVLANLVLLRRDSLLSGVHSTVPAEELSRLRHAPLPPSSALFPPTLLDTALSKTRAASNDALVHKALHPPRIPKRQPQQQNRASSSSAAPADRSGVSPLVPCQQQAQRGNASAGGNCNRPSKGKKPFHHSSGRPGNARGGGKCSGKRQNWPGSDANTGGGVSVTALETVAGNRSKPVGGFHPQGWIPNPVTTSVLFPTYPFDSPKALALRQEVETMISKGALERVFDPCPGFYSRLFLVEKASGGWRPVIDLSLLSTSLYNKLLSRWKLPPRSSSQWGKATS